MLFLYKVNFNRPGAGQLQSIIVSERKPSAAIRRAHAFLATHYRTGRAPSLDSIEQICSTPDDVLDWI